MVIESKCRQCGTQMNIQASEYRKSKSKIFFCCEKCYYEYKDENPKTKIQLHIKQSCNCATCGKEIRCNKANLHKNKLCSKECKDIFMAKNFSGENNGNWNSILVHCKYCGKEKYVKANKFIEYKKHFCDTKCMGKWQSENLSGENSPRWIKDRSKLKDHKRIELYSDPEYKKLRCKIHKRDRKICHFCGEKQVNVCLHHIEPYSINKERSLDETNIVTLCFNCHTRVHMANTVENYIYSCNLWSNFRYKNINKNTPMSINECTKRRDEYLSGSTEKCPECQSKSISHDSGCVTCQSCGWSICSI